MPSPHLELLARWEQAQAQGQDLTAEQLCPGQPELAAELGRCIDSMRRKRELEQAPGPNRPNESPAKLPPPANPGEPSPELVGETLVRPPAGDDPHAPKQAAPARVCLGLVGPPDGDAPFASTLPGAPATREPSLVPAPVGTSPPGYLILGELGRGAMGVVYKARHTRLNRVVALKMILGGGHAGPEERLRFMAEAELIASIEHPGIVQVYDFGTHDQLPFFSLELCPGGSLAGKLEGTPLEARLAARTVEQVARAIQAAHERGIVHRDLKPANVLLDEDGNPKVTDFGLAKRVELGPCGLTATGSVMGTPSYMAPEQAEGKKEVGPAADVYALGAVFYECLTGRPPFRAATVFETLQQVVRDEPVPPRQLNPAVAGDLETVCLKCLHKAPAGRYHTAAELADDLARWRTGEPIAARPAGRLERAVKWARRRPTAAALLGVSVLAVLGLAVLSVVAVLQWQRAVAALKGEHKAQVDTLLSADPLALERILDKLATQRKEDLLPRLRQVWDEPATPDNRRRRMRAALALLPFEPTLVRDDLVSWMLEGFPPELLLVRHALTPHAEALRADLWRQLEPADVDPQRRLRLLAALAGLDPGGAGWRKVDETALEPWLTDNPLNLAAWTRALEPARASLVGPLSQMFHCKLPERRAMAAYILSDYVREPRALVELIVQADDRQFAYLLPALQRQWREVLPLLRQEAGRQASTRASEADREGLARRQAGAVLALARLGEADRLWPLLKHSPYPETRSRLTLRLGPAGVEARALAERLGQEKEVSTRRALILALGAHRAEQVPLVLRHRLVEKLLSWYRDDPDAGIHGAIDWLLRHGKEGPVDRPLDWGQAMTLQKIDEELASRPQAGKRWYVNSQGQTLTVVDSQEPVLMGSPAEEKGRDSNEELHWRRIGRRYAIATKPVTVAQFERFLKAHPEVDHTFTKEYSPEADCPVNTVTWHEAAQYCRWLSEQEAIPEDQMVYPGVAEIEKCKKGGTVVRLPANHLKRRGYRLPTEAEWECACRAGACTSRYYGSSPALLTRYAWHSRNAEDQTWPVGQKRPNDLGLFDMHGNIWQWCQESGGPYPSGTPNKPAPDEEDTGDVTARAAGILRGASYRNAPLVVRSGYRNLKFKPGQRLNSFGFRLARTCD
jgi:formylglycine-generating enzyme required for sulfatase activity